MPAHQHLLIKPPCHQLLQASSRASSVSSRHREASLSHLVPLGMRVDGGKEGEAIFLSFGDCWEHWFWCFCWFILILIHSVDRRHQHPSTWLIWKPHFFSLLKNHLNWWVSWIWLVHQWWTLSWEVMDSGAESLLPWTWGLQCTEMRFVWEQPGI